METSSGDTYISVIFVFNMGNPFVSSALYCLILLQGFNLTLTIATPFIRIRDMYHVPPNGKCDTGIKTIS